MRIQTISSPNYNKALNRRIDLVVLHTMEAPEKGDTAESIAHFFAKPKTKASSHYCMDNNSVVRCVDESNVAWAAPGANHDGIQLEHAGYARQKAADWDDAFSRAMLKLSAELTAEICKRHRIPMVYLTTADVASQRRGITIHRHVSEAFGLSSHWDTGYSFPIQSYLRDVRRFHGATTDVKPDFKQPEPVLRQGMTGWKVRQAERLLDAAHQNIKVDGVFDKWTKKAVEGFQRHAGLDDDGVIGPATWKALWQHRYLHHDEFFKARNLAGGTA